jgi:GDP/UDP-N,N'-diacetylbacillosamine 2-epimerase (hydrolysing)
MRKICVVTGSRAEYGLLRALIGGIEEAADLTLQLVVTGMHLSPEFGLTWQEMQADGFRVARKVEMLLSSDTPSGVTKSMGLGLIGFADVLAELEPDLLLVLGDRFEILAAVSAALVARIPVAHLHGGESSEGLIDEAIRHSITKMSHLHFVANEKYKKRVMQLGEAPDRIWVSGGLGVDAIVRLPLLSRSDLEASMGFKFRPRNLLVTFHPVTLEADTAPHQMSELLQALGRLENTGIIFTLPNADTNGRAMISMIDAFVASHPNSKSFSSLGQLRYFSCVAQVDGVVGNSSSGLLEVPSFRKGTINIGDRQNGRLMADSVINCAPTQSSIADALQRLFSSQFQAGLPQVTNPYGKGGASDIILDVIRTTSLDGIVKKRFYDIP